LAIKPKKTIPQNITDKKIEKVWNSPDKKFIDYDSYKVIGDKFFDAIKKETSIAIDYEAFKDTSWIERTALNVYQFAAAKDLSECMALRTVAFQSDSFNDYKEKAREIVDLNRDQWFRIEYDSAERCAVMGENWRKIEESKEMFPYWQYKTEEDDRVREEHEILDNLVFKIGDPEGDECYPPNAWNCFKAKTLVKTPNGWNEINKLRIGDFVLSGSGNKEAINFIYINKFNGQLLKIINKRGYVLCTNNHSILTIKGWKTAERIKNFDIIINHRNSIGLNNAIIYINNCYVFARYIVMSLIVKRQTCRFKALNSNIQFRNKNINPIRTYIEVMFNFISQRMNMIYHNLLAFCGFSSGVNMKIGMQGIGSFHSDNTFIPDFRITETRINLHPFRLSFNTFRSFFSFTKICMRNLGNITSHFASLFIFPFVCIYPLSLYCLSAFSNWYIKIIEEYGHKSIIANIPSLRKFFTRIKLNRIKFVKSIGSGTFLNRFNSRYVFLYNFFFHNEFNLVTDTKVENYFGNIYNLSINNDETYITEIGIVHNCRCHAEPLDDNDLKEQDKEVSEGSDYLTADTESGKPIIPEEFRFNPGKQIMPNEGDYFQVLPNINRLDNEDFDL
jgi:hypothetical protein